MDPITLVYYAAICAVLSALSPRFRTLPWRVVVGAGVGLVAAGALPSVRAVLGI